jgi:hypothetical protein
LDVGIRFPTIHRVSNIKYPTSKIRGFAARES